MILSSRGLARSYFKPKPSYLHNRSVYDHQTMQDGNLPLMVPTYKFTRPFHHLVLEDHLTNYMEGW